MVRDAMLAVSGALDPRLGGPGFREFAIDKAAGHASHPVRRRRAGRPRARPPDALPDLGPRRPERLPRRLRLPRPLDHRPAPARHHHAAPGPRPAEQRPDAPPGRPLRRPAPAARRATTPARQVERAYRLAFGRPPTPTSGERARRVVERVRPGGPRPGDLQQQRIPLRRLTDDARPGGRPWTVAIPLLGPQRPRRRRRGRPDAPRRHAPGRASPARPRPPCPHFAPKATRAIHICLVRRAEPRRLVRLQAGLIACPRQVAAVRRAARRLLRPGRPAPQARLGVPPARRERPLGLRPLPAPRRGRRRADRDPLDGRRDLEPHPGDVPGEQRLPAQRLPRARVAG